GRTTNVYGGHGTPGRSVLPPIYIRSYNVALLIHVRNPGERTGPSEKIRPRRSPSGRRGRRWRPVPLARDPACWRCRGRAFSQIPPRADARVSNVVVKSAGCAPSRPVENSETCLHRGGG